jgi:hypothetical protein
MAVHVGFRFGSHRSYPGTRLLPIEQKIEFRKQDQETPLPAADPVKIANARDLTSKANFEDR